MEELEAIILPIAIVIAIFFILGKLFSWLGSLIAHVWPYLLIFGVIWLVISLITKANKEKVAQIEEKRVIQSNYQREQQGYHKQMIVLGEESISFFEGLPKYLENAEKFLDLAEYNFSEGAFAPFWDSIERTAKTLGHFDEGVQHIIKNSHRYAELIVEYEDTPPQFPLSGKSIEKLNVSTGTIDRMNAIVRIAQRNYHFASIYEQRKTNQILVAGFANLADALDQMTWKITESIDDLAGSVDVMTSTLNESLSAIHSRVGNVVDITEKAIQQTRQHHDELMEKTSEGAAREEKVLKMLDNIQRGRRPS